MSTIVITGATDGIGRALAETYLRRGDTVAAVGRSASKGRSLVQAARSTTGEAHFIAADLSSVGETRRVAGEIASTHPVVDALVFCARHYRSTRTVTEEGFEENFALFYLGRHVLGYELLPVLVRADAPIIVNVAGPGASLDVLRWNDLQLSSGYHGNAALGHGGKLNDLLGVAFAADPRTAGVRYLLVHPGVTATSFSGDYEPSIVPHIESMRRTGRPIADSIAPIVDHIDSPRFTGLAAVVEGHRIAVTGRDFDRTVAHQLAIETDRLLSGQPLGVRQAAARR